MAIKLEGKSRNKVIRKQVFGVGLIGIYIGSIGACSTS